MSRLKIASEKAKIKLTYEKQTIIELNEFYNKEMLYIKLTRETFENICEDIFQRLTITINKAIEDSKIEYTKIKELIFVGGSTRIPKLKEIIHNFFIDLHINDSLNPEETVAYGAAILAAKVPL